MWFSGIGRISCLAGVLLYCSVQTGKKIPPERLLLYSCGIGGRYVGCLSAINFGMGAETAGELYSVDDYVCCIEHSL